MQFKHFIIALLYAAGFSLIVASIITLGQDNLKSQNLKLRLTYSTVSQLAYNVGGTDIVGEVR